MLASSSVSAQIVPDRTLNTQVNLIDGQQKITGGIESGNNLFHSFKKFSPTPDFDTHFDNNNNIQNIFTRVTGGSESLIDGLIKANNNASLFILNPAGIIFGNNVKLDIGGSFITTTAESIIFDDGTKFETQVNQTSPLLTVSIPSGLQFGNAPGAISSNNTEPIILDVSPEDNIPPGNTIAFLGGNIDLQNISIKAFSGNVEIGSVAGGELINLLPSNNGWEFEYNDFAQFNDIKISQQSRIETSGQFGNINLRGKDIFLNPDSFFINATNTDIDAGIISLVATNYIEIDSSIITSQVETLNQNGDRSPVKGKGGNITLVANDIKITNGSAINASTRNQGDGGNITIDATESLELSGFDTQFPSLILTIVNDIGEGGTINITTEKLTITDGARIDSRSFGKGKAGNITVNAQESIFISGSRFSAILNQEFNSGLLASSGAEDSAEAILGESGKVNVHTAQLSIENGGEISVSSFGSEDAGNIEINVGELSLKDNSQIIAKTASGNGGSIDVNSNEIIVLRAQASIAATADFNGEGNDGDGGNITLAADNIVLFDDSIINADANLGSGGKITITTQGLFTEDNAEDAITASSQVEGLDGIVTINTPDINSKFEATQTRINTLAGEESIYTGCNLGTDFSANKFSYIGRGGMRKGPFDSLESQEVIADLGLDEDLGQTAARVNPNQNSHDNNIEKTSPSIIEATTWIINPQGKVELIAQASNNALPSGCLFK